MTEEELKLYYFDNIKICKSCSIQKKVVRINSSFSSCYFGWECEDCIDKREYVRLKTKYQDANIAISHSPGDNNF